MYKPPMYMRVMYRFVQISAVFFAAVYISLEQYGRVMDQVLIFILVTTVITLNRHVHELIGHNTFLLDFLHKIMPKRPEEPEAEDCEEPK